MMEQMDLHTSSPRFPSAEAFTTLKSLSMEQPPGMNSVRGGPEVTTGSTASVPVAQEEVEGTLLLGTDFKVLAILI